MNELQILLFFCAGILVFSTSVFSKNRLISILLKSIFIIGIALNIVALVLIPFFDFSFVKTLMSYPFNKVSTFILGGFLTFFIIANFTLKKYNKNLNMDSLLTLSSNLMATYFLGTGIGKFIFWKPMVSFFETSGYSANFLLFIAIIEIVGAICLIIPGIRKYAAILLFIDMLGATYTHYHNYFVNGVPDPFGNSIDSLKMQPFLLFIIFLGYKLIKIKESKELTQV